MAKNTDLFDACDPFVRASSIIGSLPTPLSDETPLRECLPGIWPTVGDLRKLHDAMVKLGWTNNHRPSGRG